MGDQELNKPFSFRLDKRDANEQKVWAIIEQSVVDGVSLRDLVVDAILRSRGHTPRPNTSQDKFLRQLRMEQQKFLEEIRMILTNIVRLDPSADDYREQAMNFNDTLLEKINNYVSEPTEYDE